MERVFYFGGESSFGGSPNFGGFDSIFGCLLDGYYTVYYFMSPPNFPQRYDFKGLTPNNYMDMDLSSIFGPKFPFWGGLGRDYSFSALASLTLAENSVYQRVNGGRGFTDLLEDCAPALPVRCHCRIGRVARL